MPPSHRHFNGLKTAALFGAIWALLLGIGALVAGGRFIWIFALIGVATTFANNPSRPGGRPARQASAKARAKAVNGSVRPIDR